VRNNDNKWGYINEKGELAIECQYEGVSSFENDKAVVKSSDDEDWQKNYRFIDSKGNDLGLFYGQIDGTSCSSATVVKSHIDGEQYSEHHLSNCPDGVRSVEYMGYNYSGGETYYPNVNIEQLVAKLAKTDNDFGPIYKKFDGNSLEFKDGDINISITVNKNTEGIITSVSFSKSSSFVSSRTFQQTETGVWVADSYDF
jgi:archaellum component FlaC